MTLNEFILKVMATPFKDKGRDYSALDCYGLVRLAYSEIFKIDLPSYSDEYTNAGQCRDSRVEVSELIAMKKRKWQEVKDYRPMDVPLFTLGGMPIHVGLMIDHRNFLHCEKKIGTVIERIDSMAWNKRLSGVFRLCQA
jgi:cell wall-associated NlpC family hydrolase